jgi:hypothetical protein
MEVELCWLPTAMSVIGGVIDTVEVDITNTKVDIDCDLNRDGTYGEDDPEEHTSPGLIVAVNNDDDDSDGIADKDDGYNADGTTPSDDDSVVGEDDLVVVTLDASPDALAVGKVILKIVSGADKVRVWSNAGKAAGNLWLDSTTTEKEWDLPADIATLGALPGTAVVEGLAAGSVELALFYENTYGYATCTDRVCLTITKVEFDNVWERNLDPLDNGNFPDYQKCIAIEHDDTAHKVSLLDYLTIEPPWLTFDDIKGFVDFHIGHQIFDTASIESDSDLVYDDDDPGDTDIYAFGLELRWNAQVVDRLIVVIYDEDTDTEYTTWTTNNAAPPSWLGELPAVHGSLGPDNSDPEPGAPGQWVGVNGLSNNYHYSAAFEMRSVKTAGGHGHQTCYDEDGNLIEDDEGGNQVEERRASCGTADAQHWSDVVWPPTHFTDDVQPFIRAAQLDGNPVDGFGALNNPLIRWGANLQAYLNRRPPHTANQVP